MNAFSAERQNMKCPFCDFEEDKVIDSRPLEEQSVIRRRRQCLGCSRRFTTYERLESAHLMVIKSDNRLEPFDKEKLRNGVLRACKKRPINSEQIDKLVNDVEYELEDYVMEVPSFVLGEKILAKLYNLDPIAYIRFASVYKKFSDLDIFIKELEKLKTRIASKTAKNTEVAAGTDKREKLKILI